MAIIVNPRIPLIDPFTNAHNGGAEYGNAGGWGLGQSSATGTGKELTVDTSVKYSGDYSIRMTPGTRGVGYGTIAQPVIPGQKYRVRFAYRTNVAWTTGFYVRVQGKANRPVGNFITEGVNPASDRNSLYTWLNNAAITNINTWQIAEFVYVAEPVTQWAAFSVYSWVDAPPTASLWFELIEFSAINSFGEGLLAEVKNVSATVIGNTPLFSVPIDRSLNVTRLSFKVASAVGTITAPPVISVGSNSPGFDNIFTSTSLINTISTGRVYNYHVIGSVPIVPAFSTVTARVNTAAVGATTLTYDISVFGDIS